MPTLVILQFEPIPRFSIIALLVKPNRPLPFSEDVIFKPFISCPFPSNEPENGMLDSAVMTVLSLKYVPMGSHSSSISNVISLVKYTYFLEKEFPEFTESLNLFKSFAERIINIS